MKWLARIYFTILLLGTLTIGLEHLLVAPTARVAVVSQFAGVDYATRQLSAFAERPLLIGIHALGGVLFAVLVPLQLSRWLRRRLRPMHRWSGWLFIISSWLTAITGVGVSYVYPFAGRAGVIPNLVSAVVLIAFTIMAVSSARKRDFAAHERWVLRVIAIGFGIVLARVMLPTLVQGFGLPASEALAQVFWLGSGTNLLLTEWWIRRGSKVSGRTTEMSTSARPDRRMEQLQGTPA